MEQALRRSPAPGRGAVHAASRADDARDPRHVLCAPAPRRAVDRRCSSTTASSTPTIRASWSSTSRRAPRRPTAPTSCARHGALRRAHRDGARDRGRGQPREGRVRSGDPGRQHGARPARDHRPAARRDPAVSVTAAAGFVAGRARVRDQGVGRARPRDRRDRRSSRRCPRPACSRRTSRRPRRCRSSRTISRDGRAAAVVLNSGNANAATGSRPARRRRMCELTGRGPRRRDRRRARVLDRLIGIPMPMAPIEAGIPKLCGDARRRDGGADAAEAILTTDTVRKEAVGDRARRGRAPSAAWRRARRCSRPRWRRCSRSLTTDAASSRPALQRALADAVARDVRLPASTAADRTNDTVLVLANGPRPARSTPDPRSPTRSPRCAARSPSRWRATPKARRSSCGYGSSAPRTTDEARTCGSGRGRTASSCSARSTATTRTGAGCSRSSARAARIIDPERVDIAYNGVTVCRDGIACAHDAAALAHVMAAREIEIRCDLHLGARRGDGPHHRPVARVHRREPAHVVT